MSIELLLFSNICTYWTIEAISQIGSKLKGTEGFNFDQFVSFLIPPSPLILNPPWPSKSILKFQTTVLPQFLNASFLKSR
jgi:hypothetical protein